MGTFEGFTKEELKLLFSGMARLAMAGGGTSKLWPLEKRTAMAAKMEESGIMTDDEPISAEKAYDLQMQMLEAYRKLQSH
jgi:hypothetical protein